MLKKKKHDSFKGQTFQEIVMSLQKFWGKYGCVLLQPYDIEVGAGTLDKNLSSFAAENSITNLEFLY